MAQSKRTSYNNRLNHLFCLQGEKVSRKASHVSGITHFLKYTASETVAIDNY